MHIENILSLFDGMSCLQQALNRNKITYGKYFASEIDKHAIKVTQANYPNTIQLGSVVDVDISKLPKIDFLGGGSPCQSFSFAGKRKGMTTTCNTEILTLEEYLKLKKEGFEFEGQSYLFWEYMRILTEIRKTNPNVKFLLENVVMGKKWESILTQAIGVHPVLLNSSRFSAQNRKRLYWTNMGLQPDGFFGDMHSTIKQPKDKGILLKDVLEKEVDEKYFLSDKMTKWLTNHSKKRGSEFKKLDGNQKASCLTTTEAKQNLSNDYIIALDCNGNEGMDKAGTLLARYHKGPQNFGTETYIKIDKEGNIKNNQNKASCFTAGGNSGGNHSDMDLIIVAQRGRPNPSVLTPKRTEYGKKIRKAYENGEIEEQRKNIQQLEPRTDGKTNTLTSVQKDNYVLFGSGYEQDNRASFEDRKIIAHDIPEIVRVRKHDVDIKGFQELLKKHKKISIKEIADKLGVPKTNVEHWFRTDTYFSIPGDDIWMELKELLGIETDVFDASIMEFEEKEGVFEKSNRVYDEDGISPTLTSTSANERIFVREVKQLNESKESNGCQPFQQNRVYDAEGISPALMAQMSCGTHAIKDNQSSLFGKIRRLTPIECCRLQTVDDNYFFDENGEKIVSETQIYRQLGNGWTVDVVAYLLGYY